MGGLGPQPQPNNRQYTAPQVSAGEIKSEQSRVAAQRVALSKWAAGLPDKSFVARVGYDEHGNISLDIFLAGGNQDLVWHNENIGHIDEANLPKSNYGTDVFGNDIEPFVTQYVGQYLGQFFTVKAPQEGGSDLQPRTPQMRFNLLKK
jgi:hypothetical protein